MSSIDRQQYVGMSGDSVDEFLCGICQGIAYDRPVLTPCCQHIYCHTCITQWLTANPQCPLDREPLTPGQLNPIHRIVRNLIDKMVVQCVHRDLGCLFTGQLNTVNIHLDTFCEYRAIRDKSRLKYQGNIIY